MLCISRREGERFIIDERIVIEIVRIKGDVVRIGIEAPKEVNVRREELPPRESSDAG